MSGLFAPVRIQRQRIKGWKLPADARICTRPGIWGNPFVCEDPAQAVQAYRALVTGKFEAAAPAAGGDVSIAINAHPDTRKWEFGEWFRANIHQLRGFNLACYCPPGAPCHVDVLLELANGAPE